MEKEPKLGSGERFKKLKEKLKRQGAKNPGAVAASIGIAKYGETRMHKMAEKGKK